MFTKIFGRGTDFIIHDKIVSVNGGVHVIQTFLSEELSEEMQIKGRTARQGEDGSYNLVLSQKSLEKYTIFPKDLKDDSNVLYDFLNKERNKFFKNQYSENTKYVSVIKEKHTESIKFIESIIKKDLKATKEFLITENKGVETAGNSRTLILLDATGSMYHLLDKAKKTLETMFNRVSEVLKESGLNENSFQIKIAVYRNYSSPEAEIFQMSCWENKAQSLINFLKNIEVSGGLGNEAIEIGLWQANQEKDLSQVILIGDMPANTQEEVKTRREKYFKNPKIYKNATFYKDELDILKNKNIPVHAFYILNNAKINFEEIAQFTNGTCQHLDIESSKGSDQLTNLINIELLRNIGGSGNGDTLVKAYKSKYNVI